MTTLAGWFVLRSNATSFGGQTEVKESIDVMTPASRTCKNKIRANKKNLHKENLVKTWIETTAWRSQETLVKKNNNITTVTGCFTDE